jgi:toxin HigB-1
MIQSFRHRGLSELWATGKTKHIDSRMWKRILRRLEALNAATAPGDMNLPGFDFHPLTGMPGRYSVHINGPWCVTFEFEKGDAHRVGYEQYH